MNDSVADIRRAWYLQGHGNTWEGQNTDPVADGRVYIVNSGAGGNVAQLAMTALDLKSGRKHWQVPLLEVGATKRRTLCLCSPAVWDGKVFVGCDTGDFVALDTASGERVWSRKVGGAVRSSPAVSAGDGRIYFGSHDGKLYALDARSGEEAWTWPTGGKVESSPCVAGGVVFVGSADGLVYAIE
jgi:outer membrane protein assembly factor BamB